METVKTVKTGNSIVLNIGKLLGLSEGEEFIINRESNGTIILVPKVEDYFEDTNIEIEDIDNIALNFTPTESEWSDE